MFSKLVKRIELDPLCCAKEADAFSKVVTLVDKLPLAEEYDAETKANEADAVVKVEAVASNLVLFLL